MKYNHIIDNVKETYKHNKRFALLVIAAVILGAVLSSVPSLILAQVVSDLTLGIIENIWGLAFMYLGALALISINDFAREYGASVFSQKTLFNIRISMLSRLKKLPIKYYTSTPTGETISRFTDDIDVINSMFSAGVVTAVADMFKIVGFVVAIFLLSPTVGFIAIASLPVMYVCSNFFRINIFKKQVIVRKKVSDINTYISEMFSGLDTIKSYGKENFFSKRLTPVLERHRLAMNANSVYDAWFPCIMQVIRAVVIALAVVIIAPNNPLIVGVGISVGAIAGIIDLLSKLFDPIDALANEVLVIQRAMAGVKRVNEFFDKEIEREKQEFLNVREGMVINIEFTDMNFEYNQGEPVLNDITLTIAQGTKCALVGRTGSGKTTLMNIIAGMYTPVSGSVTIGGVDPYKLSPGSRRKLLGIVPQTVHIFSGSIKDNITLNDETITEQQVIEALKTTGLYDSVRSLPNGIHEPLNSEHKLLSFGQQQLLSLSRAIVTKPKVILLDEVTSGMDALTESTVLSAIKNIGEDTTIVTISHRLSGIIDADMVHILDGGKIRESGSPDDLTAKKGWYSIYKQLEDNNWKM